MKKEIRKHWDQIDPFPKKLIIVFLVFTILWLIACAVSEGSEPPVATITSFPKVERQVSVISLVLTYDCCKLSYMNRTYFLGIENEMVPLLASNTRIPFLELPESVKFIRFSGGWMVRDSSSPVSWKHFWRLEEEPSEFYLALRQD